MDPGERRQSILDAAEGVFDAHGYSAATMEQVAEAAGIAKGSVYNYFKSKQDLFAQVFNEIQAGEESAAGEMLADVDSTAEKIEKLLDFWFARLGLYKRIGGLMLEFWATAARQDTSGQINKTFQNMYSTWRKVLSDIVAEGVASGEFRQDVDPQTAGSLIVGVMDGLIVQTILDVGVFVDEQFAEALKRTVIASLAANSPAADHSKEENTNDSET